MSVQLDNLVEEYYETLPELLSDLSKMIQKDLETYNRSNWRSTISCGGDYHNFIFSSGFDRNTIIKNKIPLIYENLDALHTELEYIHEFLLTQNIGNFKFDYEIISNGGKPALRVFLYGIQEENSSVVKYHNVNPLYYLSIVPLTAVATYCILKIFNH